MDAKGGDDNQAGSRFAYFCNATSSFSGRESDGDGRRRRRATRVGLSSSSMCVLRAGRQLLVRRGRFVRETVHPIDAGRSNSPLRPHAPRVQVRPPVSSDTGNRVFGGYSQTQVAIIPAIKFVDFFLGFFCRLLFCRIYY